MKPEAKLKIVINGYRLSGEKRHGRWSLACPSWPDIVDAHNGASDASGAVEEFTRRACGLGAGEPAAPQTAAA